MKLELPANWQPKLFGLLTAFAAFVKFDTQIHFPQWLESLATFMAIGGPAAFGFTAKQWNTTGGTVPNAKNDAGVVAANAGIPNGAPPAAPPPAAPK